MPENCKKKKYVNEIKKYDNFYIKEDVNVQSGIS